MLKYNFSEVSIKDACSFAEKHGIFQQSAAWCNFRKFYKTSAIMGYKDKIPVFSCVLFKLSVFCTPFSIAYATRGFVCDFENFELIEEFFEYYKDYSKKNKIVYTIFDPFADYKKDFKEPADDKNLQSLFEKIGLVKNKGLKLQPNSNYKLIFEKDTVTELEKENVYKNFTPRLKNDIELSKKRGITLEKYSGKSDRAIEIFYNLLIETTEMKGFGLRKLDYYKHFANELSDYVTIYLYKYNALVDISYTENVINEVKAQLKAYDDEINDINTTDKKRERLYPKKKEAEKQLLATQKRLEISKKHTNTTYLSASFYIKMGNKAYNFYGANSPILRELKLTANYWDMISDSIDNKAESFNMGGTLKLDTEDIKQDRMYELYKYKSEYGGEFSELVGEYHLISYPKLYRILCGKLNYFRRIVFSKD